MLFWLHRMTIFGISEGNERCKTLLTKKNKDVTLDDKSFAADTLTRKGAEKQKSTERVDTELVE